MNDHALHTITAAETSPAEPLGLKLLALNNDHAQALSWLEPARLHYLFGEAFLARRIGDLDAFMLAFDQTARYARQGEVIVDLSNEVKPAATSPSH